MPMPLQAAMYVTLIRCHLLIYASSSVRLSLPAAGLLLARDQQLYPVRPLTKAPVSLPVSLEALRYSILRYLMLYLKCYSLRD